jgi:hypothetical protein
VATCLDRHRDDAGAQAVGEAVIEFVIARIGRSSSSGCREDARYDAIVGRLPHRGRCPCGYFRSQRVER